MPRAAEASRLLLRAAAAQRAWWWAASSSVPSQSAAAAPAAAAQLAGRWSSAAPWASSGVGIGSALGLRTFSSAEAAARARRLAAAQARRQQQHERAAARLARAPAAQNNHNESNGTALAPAAPAAPPSPPPLADVDPGSLPRNDALAVARAVAHPALIVTRAIEWGTVVFGFEQANKYTVYDQDGQIVCLIAEDETGLGNALGRQLLRTRRAFTATVLSPTDGSVIFRVRRPAYLVSSTTYVETGEGVPVGEVRQRWHPLKRNFDLYVGQTQYARISGPLLAWEFQLTDDSGRTLALIDRNFQGFAKELFTDAGKYVVHFGLPPDESAAAATRTLEARSGRSDFGAVQPLQISGGGGAAAGASSSASPPSSSSPGAGGAAATTTTVTDAVAVIPQATGGQLAVARPLALDERMVALAAAVAIDFAFFSQHSHTSGMFAPPLLFPMPLPGGGGAGPAAEEAGSGEGAAPVGGGEGGVGGGAGGGFGGASSSAAAAGGAEGASGAGGAGGTAGGGDEGWSWDDGGSKGGGEGGGDGGWSPWGGGGGGEGDDDGGAFDDGEGGGTVGSVVRGLWRVFGDDD